VDELRVSVVIPTLGMHATLDRVLARLERQDPAAPFEVLVVADIAEPDPAAVETLLADRPYAARLLRGQRPGVSSNRNAGWRAARSELVLFLDNDTLPQRQLIREHVAWHDRHPEPEVSVLGHVQWAPEVKVTPFMRWLEQGIQFDYDRIVGTEAGWGRFYTANISTKRVLLERVGGFDEINLPYGYEDLDFAYRASAKGLRVLYNRRAVVDHLRTMSLDFWKRRVRRIATAESRFVALHPEVGPYFHRMFSDAAARPAARGRGRCLLPWISPRFPWLGPKVWMSADLYYKQALAPGFLEAWSRAANESRESAPDLREHHDAAGS
jgi:GT2 family glycosyltransferase